MLLACSHVVLASDDVPRITRYFGAAFGMSPGFENDMFAEFVLSSKFRIAFFKPVGASARTFRATADRTGSALGVTVDDVDAAYRRIVELGDTAAQLSGPPKEHPWGERASSSPTRTAIAGRSRSPHRRMGCSRITENRCPPAPGF